MCTSMRKWFILSSTFTLAFSEMCTDHVKPAPWSTRIASLLLYYIHSFEPKAHNIMWSYQ
jgi:hypothetical protein